MKKIFLYFVISIFVFTTGKTEPLKKFYLSCEGNIDMGGVDKEKFFQDISIGYHKQKEGRFIDYTIISTSHPIIRPLTAISGSMDDEPLRAKAIQSIYIEQGWSAIDVGWPDGVLKVYSTTQEKFKPKDGSMIVNYNEILNLHLNTLSIRIELSRKNIDKNLIFIGRAKCSKNAKLLSFLNSLK